MADNCSEEPTVVCAWCGKITVLGSPEISHGICGRCAWNMLDESGLMDGDDAPLGRGAKRPSATPGIAAL